MYLRMMHTAYTDLFSQLTSWFVIAVKAHVLLITLTMAQISSAVPVSHDSVTINKWNQS